MHDPPKEKGVWPNVIGTQAALTSGRAQHFYLFVWLLADTWQEKVSEGQDQKNLKKVIKNGGFLTELWRPKSKMSRSELVTLNSSVDHGA